MPWLPNCVVRTPGSGLGAHLCFATVQPCHSGQVARLLTLSMGIDETRMTSMWFCRHNKIKGDNAPLTPTCVDTFSRVTGSRSALRARGPFSTMFQMTLSGSALTPDRKAPQSNSVAQAPHEGDKSFLDQFPVQQWLVLRTGVRSMACHWHCCLPTSCLSFLICKGEDKQFLLLRVRRE